MPKTSTCPFCGGRLADKDLRLHRNILCCDAGAITLGSIELRFVQALLRSTDGLTTLQLAEMVGTTSVNINSRVKQLNMKLRDIDWTMKNIGGRGPSGALYVLKRLLS